MAVDFAGLWCNQHNSEMEITIDTTGDVTGKYRTGVGAPQPTEEFDLVGFADGDLIAFSVNFGKYGSLTTWVGQHTLEHGVEKIATMWHLARNVPDPEEPAKLWGATLSGSDFFFRGPHAAAEDVRRRPSHPLRRSEEQR